VAVRVLYFLGDSELGPSDDMLYGDDVTDYLSVEDVVVGSELLAMRLTGKSWVARRG
jgi:hypothetical protein